MIPSTPSIIPQPFANAGQRNVIEDSSTVAGAPNATWAQGFPPITMMNKQAGGKPPLGMDMNGVLYQLSQNAFFEQSGGVYPWNAELNYLGGSHVMGSDGLEYIAVAPSGPEVPIAGGYVGAQDPTTDTAQAYWVPMADFYGSKRNVGETVFSLLPLTDANLHLLDGSLLAVDGIYAQGIQKIIEAYDAAPSSSNVIKVGSLSDYNNVLSGFSPSSYAKIPGAFSPGSNPWEMVFKIMTGGDTQTGQNIVGNAEIGYDSVNVAIQNSRLYLSLSSTNTGSDIGSSQGSYTIQANLLYYIRVKFTGNTYYLEYSLDGNTYTTDITISSSTPIAGGHSITFGIDSTGSSLVYPFLGSIDLSGSYININNSRWWSGTNRAGFTGEAEWQASVAQYGVCGKFVYDAGAGTLRLPKVTGHIAGTLNATALGDLIEAGLPNIKGQLEVGWGSLRGAITNAFTPAPTSVEGFRTLQGENVSGWYNKVMLDASQVSSIYNDNCTTVQPQAIKGFLYMVLANRPKTPIQVDIDNIAADLALKADVSLGNVNSTGQAAMAHAAMPSLQYIDLPVPASGGTVTAPADGYVLFYGIAPSGSRFASLSVVNSLSVVSVSTYPYGVTISIPVSKGSIVQVIYDTTVDNSMQFIYANGTAPTNP